jgi:hypothetical protein
MVKVPTAVKDNTSNARFGCSVGYEAPHRLSAVNLGLMLWIHAQGFVK